jgi:uncharacterized protein YndB with AHSA1/START domain
MATLKVTVPEATQNIIGIATIHAPLARVFQAYVDPELFAQWWCRGNPMTVHHFDCRDGGSWHITEQSEDGGEHSFFGCFHEVTANERIIQTFEYMGMPERGHVLLERADFVALDANTTEIRTLGTAQSQAGRDGMIESGAEAGWQQSVQALGKLLEQYKQ